MKTKGRFSIGKVIAFLLALSMIMTSLTVTTIGEDWTNVSGTGAMQKDISAGGTYFFKLSAATNYKSTTGSLKIPANTEVHIDINGQRFYTNNKGMSHIINEGKLFITNSQGINKGEIVNNSNDTYPVIDNKGELSIEDCLLAQGANGEGPFSGTAANTSGIGVIRNASTGKLTLSNVAACGKIVNNGGTITPLENGYFFDNVETKGFVKTGFKAVSDSTYAACKYKVVKDDTPVVTPVAWVTVDNTTTPYTDIALAKAAAQSATGTVTYEVADAGAENPLTWRDDLKASVEYSDGMIYSNDLLKAVGKAVEVTSDGTSDNRKAASIEVLADCTIASIMNLMTSAYNEEIYRLINFELNGHTITYSSQVTHLFYLNKCGNMNIYDSSEGHTGKVECSAGCKHALFYSGGYSTQKYTIYGGTFTGHNTRIAGNSSKEFRNKNYTDIKGGSFSANPAGLLDDGYYAEPDDPSSPTLWTVKKEEVHEQEITVTANGITNSYTTFQAAFGAANVAGQTAEIKLFMDATWPGALETSASKIILDLNGKKLEDTPSETNRLLQVNGNTEFVLRDSKGTGSLVTNSSAGKNGAIIVRSNGKFTFESGTFKCASSEGLSVVDGIVAYDATSVVEIKDGVIEDACVTNAAVGTWRGTIISDKAIAGGVYKKYAEDKTLDISKYKASVGENGLEYQIYYDTFQNAKKAAIARTAGDGGFATLKMLADYSTSSRQLFYDSWDEETLREITFDLNGCKYTYTGTGTSGLIATNKAGKIIIDDTSVGKTGTIIAQNGASYFLHSSGYIEFLPNYIINGGIFKGNAPICNIGGTDLGATINGGTFDADPTVFAETKEHQVIYNSDGTFTVGYKSYIVTIEKEGKITKYEKIVNAVNAILNDPSKQGTMVAFQDIALNDTLNLKDKDAVITLDLNGKTLSPAETKAFANITAGNLTIKNGTLDFTGNDNAAINVANGAVLTLDNVTLKGATTYVSSSGIVIVDGAVTTDGIVEQSTTAAAITEAQATVANDVKFTFVVSVAALGDDIGKDVTLTYTVDEMIDGVPSRKTITLNPINSDGSNYTFKFEKGIPQWSVNSDLELKVNIDGVEAESFSYTLQKYYNALHDSNPDDNMLNALLANSIYWADALQKYINGSSTVELSGWEEDYLSVATPQASENKKAVKVQAASSNEKIISASVNVYDRNKLIFTLNAKAGDTVKVVMEGNNAPVYEKTFESDVTNFVIDLEDRLAPTQYDSLFTVTLSNGGGTLSEITYSMNSYAYAKQTNETVLALYRYGHTASLYAEEIESGVEFNLPTYKWNDLQNKCTATRTSKDGKITETEEATMIIEEQGWAQYYPVIAKFTNPAFKTQSYMHVPEMMQPNKQQFVPYESVPEKHIVKVNGNYGGNYNKTNYGEGAPSNGELDDTTGQFYAINDYYNAGSTATRTLVNNFETYQQTMADTSGIASAMMVFNYDGRDITQGEFSEIKLREKYESLTGTKLKDSEATADGLVKLFNDKGYTAEANTFSSGSFSDFVDNNLKANKLILVRYQDTFKSRWAVIIGHDNMDTPSTVATIDDVVILANPFDAFDHYQDGYTAYPQGYFYQWWLHRGPDDLDIAKAKLPSYHECVVVDVNKKFDLSIVDNDILHSYPATAERNGILRNLDGTIRGTHDVKKYGNVGIKNVWIDYKGQLYGTEHLDYGYFAYPDYYNMKTDTSKGIYILPHYQVFQQNMASACGICSTFSVLNYYKYDFSQIYKKLKQSSLDSAICDLVNIPDNFNEAKEEALVKVYMEHDSYFDTPGREFNNYGGVGAGKLKNIAETLGYKNVTWGNYTASKKTKPFPTYESFVEQVKTNLKNNIPTVISWDPFGGHWQTIIGFVEGKASTHDDIIILADSSDSADQYRDGYNTHPGEQFYARWFNGTASLGQAHVYFPNKK